MVGFFLIFYNYHMINYQLIIPAIIHIVLFWGGIHHILEEVGHRFNLFKAPQRDEWFGYKDVTRILTLMVMVVINDD